MSSHQTSLQPYAIDQRNSPLRRECLDNLLIHDERHLRQVLTEYSRHYNGHRPHQSREQRPPLYEPGQAVDVTARINRRASFWHGTRL
jgi:hypothetical protein